MIFTTRILLSFWLWLLAATVWAQSFPSTDSLTKPIERISSQRQSILDNVSQSVIEKMDTVYSHYDSVQQALQTRRDSLDVVLLADTLRQRYDTLRQQISQTQQKLMSQLPNEPDVAQHLPNVSSIPPSPTLPSLPQLTTQLTQRFSAGGALRRVQSLKTQASQYAQQLTTQVQQGTQALQNVSALPEQRVDALPEMKVLQQHQTAQADWQSQQLGKPTVTDHLDQLPEKIQREVVQRAAQHFSEHTEAIEQGQQQLDDLKKKYEQVQSEKDVYQRATSLKGKPWTARLLLGSYFQLYRKPDFKVDLSPFIGYRFNTRWSVGLGGSYRVTLHRVAPHRVAPHRLPLTTPIYQGRAFVESVVYKGFVVHATYERSWLPLPHPISGEPKTTHPQHLLLGIGKTYQITEKVQGTTLLLYRLGSLAHPLQLTRWNVRTGFLLNW